MDVALVSCANLPEPDLDAAPLAEALDAAGIDAEVMAWDDPAVDWSAARLTVLRSSWNYPLEPEAFLAWAEATSNVSQLWNPLPVIRWNLHKSYLLDLARRGIPVTPTVLLRRGAGTSLAEILDEHGWNEVVVKPAVSAASFRTLRVDAGTAESGEAHLRDLLAERDVLVQPYLRSVEGRGERALVSIDRELTHAVRKSPRFSGQDESVSDRAVDISPQEADLARRVCGVIEDPILYARIDVAAGPEGSPVVMELELIEPSLFFVQCTPALDRFVAAIAHRLELPAC